MDSLALQFKKELNKKETEREKNLEKGFDYRRITIEQVGY